jgi:hypothetical protein
MDLVTSIEGVQDVATPAHCSFPCSIETMCNQTCTYSRHFSPGIICLAPNTMDSSSTKSSLLQVNREFNCPVAIHGNSNHTQAITTNNLSQEPFLKFLVNGAEQRVRLNYLLK